MATADVVIVGGGVLGAATAFELVERGLDVVLLERALPGRQGSGTTAGNLHIQAIHSRRPDQDVAVDAGRLVPLQRTASELWGTVAERLGRDVGIVRSGGFTVAETEDDLAELHAKAVWEAAAGIPTEVLDGDAARAALPQLGASVLGATWCPWDGYANSLLATPAYLAAARARGARIYTDAPVTALRRESGAWRVESPLGVVSAPVVVNAAGPWIQQVSALAGVGLRMAPLAIQMLETVRAPRFLPHLVQHIGIGLSVKQVLSGSVVIGGGWPASELQLGGITPVRDESVAGNLGDAVRVVPEIAGLRLARAWSGPLAATPDEMPVVGEVPGLEGLYVEGGTYAFTFSPLWARTVADRITGVAPLHDVDDLGPARLLGSASPTLPAFSPAPTDPTAQGAR
ncbi:FAD-binding oxidoreductase [Rathayibacter sp. VKM Ac-2835]|nr:FAD-binding oxidoreductase [Rathayibacter sp. VKM Ac-2835]